MNAPRKPVIYRPRRHYTPAELLAAEIMDLETDIRCARRDGWGDYAVECEARLAEKLAKREAL